MTELEIESVIDLVVFDDDRLELLSLLDTVEVGVFETKGDAQKILSDNIKFGSILKNFFLKSENNDLLLTALTTLREKIKQLPCIDIIISVEPNDRIRSIITNWGKSYSSGKVIYKIVIKPEIIGGAIIVDNGKYIDFSLSRKLNDAFENKQEEITRAMNQEAS